MSVAEHMRSWARRIGSWALRIERDGVALWLACKHPKTPLTTKALCVFAVAYALNPMDLYTDFIPILGYLDDVILVPGLIWLTIKLLPSDVLTDCRGQGSESLERKGKWRIRFGIALVVVVWALVAYAISQFFHP